MLAYLLAALLFLTPQTTRLSGTVADAQTGQPIPAADVALYTPAPCAGFWHTYTDAHGGYFFDITTQAACFLVQDNQTGRLSAHTEHYGWQVLDVPLPQLVQQPTWNWLLQPLRYQWLPLFVN